MRYIIDARILAAHPDVKIGVLVGRELRVEEEYPGIERLKRLALEEAREKLGSGTVTRHPFIASWRDMYRSFGTRPGDYRPSAEALVRRALKVGELPSINSAVDAYNAVSVRHLIPMGGFDLDRIEGDIELRYSEGGEAFQPLGAGKEEETYPGEPVYADQARVLTRRWNYRDCDRTKITAETTSLVMFVDGSPEVPRESVEEALERLEEALMETCGGSYQAAIADAENTLISLD